MKEIYLFYICSKTLNLHTLKYIVSYFKYSVQREHAGRRPTLVCSHTRSIIPSPRTIQ